MLALAAGLIMWGCSKDSNVLTLKRSFEKGTTDINTAISSISATKGYQMLIGANDQTIALSAGTKSEAAFRDSITLSLVAGIYDFQPNPGIRNHFIFPYRIFKKTGASDKMIVNIPDKLIFHPRYLHYMNLADSTLKNNFKINASDYHLYYNWWNSYDYKLLADFTLNSEPVGSLDVTTGATSFHDNTYSSSFTFPDGYSILTSMITGDTTKSSFSLMKDKDILLKEATAFIWKGKHRIDRQYTLTIGNIDIKKVSGIDSIQVYLNGVLQKEAAAFITDSSETTGTICEKRDILLTFDDGTTAKLSTLIDPARSALRNLIGSLHSMSFAKNIVDYIALSIYCNTH
jgi:hypothetical protein